jgi:cell division protein FtsI (penicillin-binding protein 3)
MHRFGIGSRMGLDLPGEQQGILHPLQQWSRISASRIGIGQGVAVTALQLLGVYCAIANDGFLMRPYVVQKVVKSDGTLLFRAEPDVLSRPITGQTAATMRQLLARVTEDGGTGRKARIEGYTVAGKTGTAQKPVGGVYSESDYTSSFVGFFPVEQPEIGMIVVVDEPQPEHTGGLVAAPVFSEIGSQIVRYLDIPTTGYQTATATGDSSAVTD